MSCEPRWLENQGLRCLEVSATSSARVIIDEIFRSHDDYLKFTNLVTQQKVKRPFYLYAYCLMPNHAHLLIERQEDAVGITNHTEFVDRL